MADPAGPGPAEGAPDVPLPDALPPDALWDDWDMPPRFPDTPEFHLDGFDGSLDLLLDLAERERIDLGRIAVVDLVDQLAAAMLRYERHVALERRADWLVAASRLLLLRSRLLLPGPGAAEAARAEAGRELERLQAAQFVRAAAAWLEARPQLGRDVFAAPRRGRDPHVASYMRLMEACLAVLEREEEAARPLEAEVYRPALPALFRVGDALARMRRQLAGLTEPAPLVQFLPRLPGGDGVDRDLLARSAVSSTFLAALELARTAELTLDQTGTFDVVFVSGPPRDDPASYL